MSAHYFGPELKATKRYQLGQLLGRVTRHLLLMTATPHAGKQEDFQLFMALLDGDRFEGRYRDGVHSITPEDLMETVVEDLREQGLSDEEIVDVAETVDQLQAEGFTPEDLAEALQAEG